MESAIAALTASQISRFFSANGRATQQECDTLARRITGQPTVPAPVQGESSYTVIAGDYVIRFRVPNAVLDLEFLRHVEKAYHGFMPCHSNSGTLGNLLIYKMRNVGGVSFYLARDNLLGNGCLLLRRTVIDFERFRPVLKRLASRLPAITAVEWPLVPNHIDLLENNIHVDPSTGKLAGICDCAGTEISPFGMSLGAVENILGIPKFNRKSGRTDHVYHANHRELRGLFYDEFYGAMGSATDTDKERIEDARLIGLFLTNAWQYDETGNQLPAGENDHGLQHLDAVLRGTCDGY